MNDDAPVVGSAGLRLRARREAAGLSQRALARRAGTSPETNARLEAGVVPPRAATVRKLASAFGVPPADLVDDPDAWRNAPTAGTSGRAAAVLAAHGVTQTDAASLTEALRARGWQVSVAQVTKRKGSPRIAVLIWRVAPGPASGLPSRRSLRATKPTEEQALTDLLAKVLARDG